MHGIYLLNVIVKHLNYVMNYDLMVYAMNFNHTRRAVFGMEDILKSMTCDTYNSSVLSMSLLLSCIKPQTYSIVISNIYK